MVMLLLDNGSIPKKHTWAISPFLFLAQKTIQLCRFGQVSHRVPPALCTVVQAYYFSS
jgi:hypothetical protein